MKTRWPSQTYAPVSPQSVSLNQDCTLRKDWVYDFGSQERNPCKSLKTKRELSLRIGWI